MTDGLGHLNQPVTTVARTDVTRLRHDLTVGQALDAVRREGIGEKIVYFYVVDEGGRLVGVLPTRRLLTAPLDRRVSDSMITNVVTIPDTATVLDACELFVMHKFLAFPVVDDESRIVGIVDVGIFTEEVFDIAEREHLEDIFESIGFRISQVRGATPARAFRFRFPWLLATITGGTVCAVLTGVFELTLARSLILAFFLTLVLGLGESVAIQSMTVTIQALRVIHPSFAWYLKGLRNELVTAFLLGAACGGLVGMITLLMHASGSSAFAMGMGILLSVCSACFFGMSIPALLHGLRLDPKIAAGPVTLALTDIFTIFFYFGSAALML